MIKAVATSNVDIHILGVIKYSVIIATCNRCQQLKSAIESVKNQTYKVGLEIIVIDQSDENKECQQEIIEYGVRYFYSDVKGLSRARNHGINEAVGKYIVFLDDDALWDKSFLENVDEFFTENLEYKGFFGIIKNVEDGMPFSRYMDNNECDISLNKFQKCMSSAMVIEKTAIKIIGMFDVSFGIGGIYGGSEETDVVLRLLWNNQKMHYSPSAVVYHAKFEPKDLNFQTIIKKSFTYGIGRGAMIRKHFYRKISWSIKILLIELVKPLGGILLSIFKIDSKGIARYSASIIGRMYGFIIYYKEIDPEEIK